MNASQAPLKGALEDEEGRHRRRSSRSRSRGRSRAETFVAQAKSRCVCQSTARSTRPPSRGNAGSRLNTSRIRFSVAEPREERRQPLRGARGPMRAPSSATPMTSDTAGPASAILSSAAALGEHPLEAEPTPPKSQSVIPSSSIPSRRAGHLHGRVVAEQGHKEQDRGDDRHRDVRAVR